MSVFRQSVGDALRVRVVDATGSGLAGEIRQPRGLGRVLGDAECMHNVSVRHVKKIPLADRIDRCCSACQ